MATQTGQKDQALITGRIFYVYDGTNAYAVKGGTDGRIVAAQREPFIFRPGAAAIASGAVASGTRSGGGTITTGASTATFWGTEVIYAPLRTGKIDGKATGGILQGQLTIGTKSAAGTVNVRLTARMRNNPTASTADTTAWTTVLAVSATISVTTAETFQSYDLPYLLTAAGLNAVPLGLAIGIDTAASASAGIARIMESSYIQGEFEPLT